MTSDINRLLVVDRGSDNVELIARVAEAVGFAFASAASGPQFLTLVDSFRPTLILMDLNPGDSDGVELLRLLAARECEADVMLMSEGDERVLSAALELGRVRGLSMLGTLTKPLSDADVRKLLTAAARQERVIDAAELARALDAQELVPYYQPKASLVKDGGWTIDGVEALVRWLHPRLGVVMPDEFVPLAERVGLIGRVTEQVIDAALAQLEQWNRDGIKLKCAVNLPPTLVTDLTLPDRLARMLAERGVDAAQLTLEITETATMQEPTATMDILTRLRVKRIGLSLDDFGTGYSSLTRLYQMPFDEMKIDKSLVVNMPHSREANTIVGSLIELGHNLGLKICAEGVENRAALDMLEVLGCDRCQGFFISRALPGADIPEFIARWNARSPASSVLRVAGAVI